MCNYNHFHHGFDFWGDDLGSGYVNNVGPDNSISCGSGTECCFECYQNTACQVFSFDPSRRKCWLKSGEGKETQRSGYESRSMLDLIKEAGTSTPTLTPTAMPTVTPTFTPAHNGSAAPSRAPTSLPTLNPTVPSTVLSDAQLAAQRQKAADCMCPAKCFRHLKWWWQWVGYTMLIMSTIILVVLGHDYTIMHVCQEEDLDDLDSELWVMAYFIHLPKSG